MKKLLLAASLLLSVCVHAQVSVGLKAGVNVSNFSGGDFDAVEKKALVGFHGGLFFNFALGAISLQPEVMVSTQGAKIDSVNGSYDWRLVYANVPVMLKYRTAAGLYFELGPQFGFKLSEDVKNETIENFAKDLDLSAAAGLGFQTKRGLGIGARYLVGLSKVGDFDQTANNPDPDFKNSVLQVSITFPLSR